MRQQAICLESENRELRACFKALEAKLEAAKQDWLDPAMRDRLSRLETKFFGFGREARKKGRAVGHERQELLVHGGRTAEEPAVEAESPARCETSLAKRHEAAEKDLEEEASLRGIVTGCQAWEEIPKMFEESKEITVTERIYTRVVHQRVKYRLKPEYNNTGKEVIITAKGPAKLKPGCEYSIDFALSVASDKYEYHLPLERQRRKMEAAGFPVEVKTLYSLCEAVAEHGRNMTERIRSEILEDFCAAHLDESPWRILGSGENGYMWVLSNRRGAYYRFEPTRSGKVPVEMLKGYRGSAVTDGYSGYNPIRATKEIRVGHCWAHLRREFFERYADFSEAEVPLDLIDKLFDIEAKGKTFEQLRELRKKNSRPVVDELFSWCRNAATRYLPGEGIAKAIQYCLNHTSGLRLFLDDLSVPLTNNDAERALRHAVIGRKNYAGSKTINGADTAAALFTLIESAKRNSLQPTEYMRYLITERWYGREPLTPMQYAFKTLGENKKIKFPAKDDWRI